MTYDELLSRLYDMRRLADKFSGDTAEKSGCISSFDRKSTYDSATDTYISWDANDDGIGCIRKNDDGSIVAFEMEGPGVIWRVWSALPQSGRMKVYLDGSEAPEIDLPFEDWFSKNGDELPPLNLSQLSMNLSRGRNSYIPIPFQHSCKVVFEEGWGMYYHFTYTRFPSGTVMPSYRERFTDEGELLLAKADARLYERGEDFSFEDVQESSFRVEAGEKKSVFSTVGSGAIGEMTYFPNPNVKCENKLILRIYWDEKADCAVESPLDEFFGGADGFSHCRTLPMSMEKYACTCRFYMPFEKGARVEIENTGDAAVNVHFAFATESLTASEARNKLRFHAICHGNIENDARFLPGGDRWPDWKILDVSGTQGRFCGMHLHIYDWWKEPDGSSGCVKEHFYGKWDKKSVDWWWGEGDEKFFVDGEKFPSTFGTGSEDYIGYAWAAEPPFARFDSPYAALSKMPLNGKGHTGVVRFQIPDCVPFKESFQGYIEKYKCDDWEMGKCLFCAVPYWYQED